MIAAIPVIFIVYWIATTYQNAAIKSLEAPFGNGLPLVYKSAHDAIHNLQRNNFPFREETALRGKLLVVEDDTTKLVTLLLNKRLSTKVVANSLVDLRTVAILGKVVVEEGPDYVPDSVTPDRLKDPYSGTSIQYKSQIESQTVYLWDVQERRVYAVMRIRAHATDRRSGRLYFSITDADRVKFFDELHPDNRQSQPQPVEDTETENM